MILGAGEIIQYIKHLSYKCEDLDLNFQSPHEAGMVMQSQSSCNKIGGGDRGIPASLWTRQTDIRSGKEQRDSVSKKIGEDRHPRLSSDLHVYYSMYVCMPTHTQTFMHIQERR